MNPLLSRNLTAASLKNISDESLSEKITTLVKTERKITYEILTCIREVEARRLYAKLGYSSMFEFLTKHLHYSEGSAQRRLQSARLLTELPEFSAQVQSGELKLSQLAKAQVLMKQEEKSTQQRISKENKKEILEQILNKNSFETEKILHQALNIPVITQETITAQQDESVLLEHCLTSVQFAKLKQAKDLFSHVKHNPSMEELVELLCDFAISKKTPSPTEKVRKSTKPQSEEKSPALTQGFAVAAVKSNRSRSDSKPKKSRYISAKDKREVFRRAETCEYISPLTGKKCVSQYQPQTDHVIPVARGGGNELSNLRRLCRTHNLLEARRWGLN